MKKITYKSRLWMIDKWVEPTNGPYKKLWNHGLIFDRILEINVNGVNELDLINQMVEVRKIRCKIAGKGLWGWMDHMDFPIDLKLKLERLDKSVPTTNDPSSIHNYWHYTLDLEGYLGMLFRCHVGRIKYLENLPSSSYLRRAIRKHAACCVKIRDEFGSRGLKIHSEAVQGGSRFYIETGEKLVSKFL